MDISKWTLEQNKGDSENFELNDLATVQQNQNVTHISSGKATSIMNALCMQIENSHPAHDGPT